MEYFVRQIIINRVLNGYVVAVGCQTVVFESAVRLLSELGRYLENPQRVEDEYQKASGGLADVPQAFAPINTSQVEQTCVAASQPVTPYPEARDGRRGGGPISR